HWPLSREPGGLVDKSVKLKEYYTQQGLTGLRAEDALNKLDICGHAYSIARGKELALIISNDVRDEHWIVRCHFGTEGHVFGLPTSDVRRIMDSPPVKRPSAEKSKAFEIPLDLCKGPKTDPLVSILATFERPEWSLAFVDHNVMLTMHVMRLRKAPSQDDVSPGGSVWARMWSASHGPVPHLEPDAAAKGLDKWFGEELKKSKKPGAASRPICDVIQEAQQYCNGIGRQEAHDVCLLALIHPCMPSRLVFASEAMRGRLKSSIMNNGPRIIAFLQEKADLLPRLSRKQPFKFDETGHTTFIPCILAYRREWVPFTRELFNRALELGLLEGTHKYTSDGSASGSLEPYADFHKPSKLQVRRECEHARLKNYRWTISVGNKECTYWSPFIPRWGETWQGWNGLIRIERPNVDLREILLDSTLGPYSFLAFCQMANAVREKDSAQVKRPPGRPPKHARKLKVSRTQKAKGPNMVVIYDVNAAAAADVDVPAAKRRKLA
ncbi:hypothetical protein FB107DRAFT_280447, partial [Schizophyllum commune]